MDAVDFFLLRYEAIHRALAHDLLERLTEPQIRTRPQPGVNTVAWLVWHAARVEDVVAETDRFIVVEKREGEPAEVAARTDPRS